MALFSERIALVIDANAAGAIAPLGALEKQAKKADSAFDSMAKKAGVTGSTLKSGLVAGAAAFASSGLVQGIKDMSEQYANAAKAADDLAGATGSSIETVSRMQAALTDAGVSAEQSAAMLTKFTTVASGQKGAQALKDLNVQLVRGKDGATDYAASMTAAVDAIGQIGDASERNRQLVTLFGKQGAKAFQDLLNAGMSFSEAQATIAKNRIFTAQDARDAQDYDAAMDSLDATMQTVSITVGRVFVPAIVDAAEGLGVLADAAARIPNLDEGLAGLIPTVAALRIIGGLFGDDADQAEKFGAAMEGTTDDSKEFTEALKKVETVAAGSAEEILALSGVVAGLNDDFIAAEDASDRARAAMQGWVDALKEGKGLDEDRQAALREAVQAQATYTDALVKTRAPAREIKSANDSWISSLYASAAAAGVSRDEVDDYIEKLGFIPDEVVTRAIANTLSAEDNIEDLRRKIHELPDDVDIPVHIRAIIQNPGAFRKVERLMNENFSIDVPITVPTPSAMSAMLSATPSAAPGPSVTNVSNTYAITVPGAGSPATTARELERHLRRIGDRAAVSVVPA